MTGPTRIFKVHMIHNANKDILANQHSVVVNSQNSKPCCLLNCLTCKDLISYYTSCCWLK